MLSDTCPFYVLETMRNGPALIRIIEDEQNKVLRLFTSIQETLKQIKSDIELDEDDEPDEWGLASVMICRDRDISIPSVQRKLNRIIKMMRSKQFSIEAFKADAKNLLDKRQYLFMTPQDINQQLSNASASVELKKSANQGVAVIKNNMERINRIKQLLAELNQITRCDALVTNDILANGVNTNFESIYIRSYNSLRMYVERILGLIRAYQEDFRRNDAYFTMLKQSIDQDRILQQRYQFFLFMASLEWLKNKIVSEGEELFSFFQEVEADIGKNLAEDMEILQRRREWREENLGNKVCRNCNTVNDANAQNCCVCGHHF